MDGCRDGHCIGRKEYGQYVIDGLRTIDEKASAYSEVDWGPGINDINARKKENAKHIEGSPISAKEAQKIAANFVGMKQTDGVQVVKSKSKHFPVYSASVKKPRSNDKLSLDITTKGGHVVWMMNNRDVKDRKLSLKRGQQSAEKFVKQHGFDSMQTVGYDDYGNEAEYTMVYQQDDVSVYPDLITVKVALDNGEVMAFESSEYTTNHKKREIPKPKLSEKEALKHVNPNLKVDNTSLALIALENGEEALCYEVLGSLGKSRYRIFINADSGDEEKIEKLKNVDLESQP